MDPTSTGKSTKAISSAFSLKYWRQLASLGHSMLNDQVKRLLLTSAPFVLIMLVCFILCIGICRLIWAKMLSSSRASHQIKDSELGFPRRAQAQSTPHKVSQESLESAIIIVYCNLVKLSKLCRSQNLQTEVTFSAQQMTYYPVPHQRLPLVCKRSRQVLQRSRRTL